MFNVWVASILLHEQLQVPTSIVQYVGEDLDYYRHDTPVAPLTWTRPAYNYAAVERGSFNFSCAGQTARPTTADEECTHGMLEVWSGQQSQKQEYIVQRRTVEDGGILTAIGQVGWYTNTFILDRALEVASFRGLVDPNRTALLFKKPLTFGQACARSTPTREPTAALCAAFAAEFLTAEGATAPTWASNGIDAPALRSSYHIETLPADAASALAARLGVATLPAPFYAGAFETDAHPTSGQPIGHMVSVPCDWTSVHLTGLERAAPIYQWLALICSSRVHATRGAV